MHASVKKLEPLVSSQIAAGEVVERPASVVKELLENSIDAGAKRIIVDIDEGGLKLVRVSDNGIGMTQEDALSAIERFATSKISSVSDLECIRTLGFRGEALPSIAACSRLTLETKTDGSDSGIAIYIDGGKVTKIEEKGLPTGTTVTVEDLFFNTPARLKFMKSKSRERDASIEVVERLALAWPHISFTLNSQNKTIFHTSGTGARNALTDIFGPNMTDSVIEIHGYDNEKGVTIEGFIGTTANYRASRDRQLFSVNQRPVRNSMLGWAVDAAYLGLLPPKSYPTCILNINIPPDQIDVNVHPTKAEVKFKDEREIRRLVTETVRRSLSEAGYLFDPIDSQQTNTGPIGKSAQFGNARSTLLDYGQNLAQRNEVKEAVSSTSEDHHLSLPEDWEYLGDLQGTYLLVRTKEALLIVDQHALAESIAYQSLLRGESGRQDLLIPEILQLGAKEAVLYEEYGKKLEEVGFSTRPLGARTVLVTEVPVILGKALSPDSLIEILSSAYGDREEGLDPARILAKAQLATAACHSSVRGNEPLDREEALALISRLATDPSTLTCPHGRPTVYRMPYSEIAKFFGR